MKMRKLARKKAHREHILRNLLTSLVLYERIVTTGPKAKDVKILFDRLMTLTKKRDEIGGRRILKGFFFDTNAVKKIYDVLLKRFKKRTSGYLKIYKMGPRVGDAAQKVIIELTDRKQKIDEAKKLPHQETTEASTKEVKTMIKTTKQKKGKR